MYYIYEHNGLNGTEFQQKWHLALNWMAYVLDY